MGEPVGPDARSQLEFALNLHRHLPAAGNLCWSPYSVGSALGLAAAGASGRTRAELVDLLLPGDSGLLPGDGGADPGDGGGDPGDGGADSRISGGDPGSSGADPGDGGGDPGDGGADSRISGGDPGSSGGDDAALARFTAGLAGGGAPPRAEVAVANTLWHRRGLTIRPEYGRRVRSWPGGAVREADFAGDPEEARKEINADVARTTRGLIEQLLAPGTVAKDSAAVLVNALYLKVAWRVAFSREQTGPAPFHAPGGVRTVPMMRQRERLSYAALAGWRMVTLPTVSDVAVDVLLPPAAVDGMAAEGSGAVPSVAQLAGLYRAATPTLVDLAVPRLRIESALALDEVLRRLGVGTAFTGDADFSGITGTPIHLDRVVHKAVARMDEDGFEGAAATAMIMRLTSVDLSEPVAFHVDRPFLVLVRHTGTGACYVLGRVVEP